MTGGSDDARPPTDELNAVDAAWDELIEETGKDEEELGPAGVHPAAAPGVERGDLRLRADDVMARLMAGEAPKLPTVETAREPDEGAAKPDPIIAAVVAKPDPIIAAVVAKPEPLVATTTPEPSNRVSRPSLQVVAGGDTLAKATSTEAHPTEGPAGKSASPEAAAKEAPKVGDVPPARASRPMEPRPAPAAPAPRTLPWAWIGVGAIALGAAAHLIITREDSSSEGRRQAELPIAVAPEPLPSPEPTPLDLGSNDGADSEGSNGTGQGDADAGSPKTKTNPKVRTGDPREPPPGTPPEIAAVFRRLPVSPYDRPPVGGIGASGIHIDHIAMGSETAGATCSGKSDDFSVDARERAGVCVRVVHPREKEELQVLWEKHDGSTRRSKMVVLPMHAYRTRGYLVLRSEYIGDWTVRILSSDGVELAHHDFTVVP